MPTFGSTITFGSGVTFGGVTFSPPTEPTLEVALPSLGITMGPGLIYDVLEGWNPLVGADVRASDEVRGQGWGTFAAAGQLGGRRVEWSVAINAASHTAALAAVNVLAAAFTPTNELVALEFTEGGQRFVLFGQVRGAAPESLQYLPQGWAEVVCRFHATDPRIYSAVEKSTITAVRSRAVGEAWPISWPADYGTPTDDGQVTVVNAGTTATPWAATLTGPCRDPRIENMTTGEILRVRSPLAAGEALYVSFGADGVRAIYLDGEAVPHLLTGRPDWWLLPPGSTTLRYLAADPGPGATMTTRHRDAYA